jgi:RNA recognition motif. (a.k.a. RRM, RBD, or RNP domain)
MSYPPPPGLQSSAPQPHASLPARPPPSTVSPAPSFKPPNSNGGGHARPAFTAFAPRSVAAQNTFRTSSPAHYSAPPVTSYTSGPQYPQITQQPDAYSGLPQPQYADATYGQVPQIRNPFIPTSSPSNAANEYGPQSTYDPELEAQIQQWQSAYVSKDSESKTGISSMRRDGPTGANTAPLGSTSRADTGTPASSSSKTGAVEAAAKTVQRSGGGTTWTDPTLLEWDPAHFRIFVGNLAGEVTDESLLKAFSKYASVQKARVIRDKRTTKSKGFGFVSFSDGDDYFQAARDMQGKYIGSHPVLIKRATTEVKPTTVQSRHKGKHGKGGSGTAKVEHGGIHKKQPKTRGGLKVLG